MLELNKIYNEDCIEGMKKIPDKSVDMILCDLPYGTTALKWDKVIDSTKLWEQYNRIIKDDGAIVLFGYQPFSSMLILSNLEMFKYSIVWDKVSKSDIMNAKNKPLRQHEDILVFSRKVDELGRLVLPIELRKILDIKEKTSLEISLFASIHIVFAITDSNVISYDSKKLHTVFISFPTS